MGGKRFLEVPSSFGGGVTLNTGAFIMNGGTISHNKVTNHGGGVYLSGGTFTLSCGSISENTSNDHGGGVYVTENKTFTMSGGNICGNICERTTSTCGGGVYCAGTFTMTGGTVSGNSAETGGGVFNGGTFNISGSPVIKQNTGSNAAIGYGKTITVNDKLTSSALIYVTKHGEYGKTSGEFTNALSGNATAANFASDITGYTVEINSSGKAELVHGHIFTYAVSEDHNSVTATCTNTGCGLTDCKATLKIIPPARTAYGNTQDSEEATLSGDPSAFGTPEISYRKKIGTSTWSEATTDAPTDAGEYRASVDLDPDTSIYVDYKIAKASYPDTFDVDIGVEMTDTEIKITSPVDANGTYEYRIGEGSWQTSPEFKKLDPGYMYVVHVRIAETDNYKASNQDDVDVWTDLTVTIDGTPCKGKTLTAKVISATEGTLSYQWYRGNEAVTGAVSNRYFLGEDDVGKAITFKAILKVNNTEVTWGSAEPVTITICDHATTELRGVVAATCTTAGYSGDKYCKDCGTKLADGHATSALGHSYSSEVTTEATCTTSGVRTYTCTRCGAVTSETISALGHDYQTYRENEIPATCTDKGSYEDVVKCSRCGKEKSRKAHTTDALGHIYKKGECIRCGASDPDYSGGEKDSHKIYVSDANGKLTGADSMAAAFKLMKDKNAAYTIYVTENVTESALTFPTVSAITFSGTGKLTLAKTLTRLVPHSSLTIDCAISNATGKSIAIAMPTKSALTVTANADVTLGALTGKSTATLVINADTEVESVTTFDAVTVAKGAALTVTNKMTGVDTLNGAVNFTGYRTTNPVKVTNIGTAEFTLTQGVVSGKAAITPVTVNNVTNGLKLTVVDINGEPVTLENKTVVAKAGSNDDIADKMTITNTDENGDPLKLTMNGKNVVVTSGKAAQNVLVTGSKGFKAYASDLTDAFTLMTDKKDTYTVELLNDVTESKLTFPTCAGLILTGEGTLTLTGTTAKLAANSSLKIDCEVVNDKKKAIAVLVPAKATFTLTENAAIKLGTLTGKSNSTLLVPFDLIVESVSTFGSVTVADGATLTVTKKLASIGTLNGNVALTGFKSTNSAKITTVGKAEITLPIGKVSGKNALAKVTVSKINEGLTLNIVDAKGKPAEIETGMTVAYAGTKTDISDKITLNAVGTYTLSQSDKEIVATAEGAKALLELDGVEYYKWGDVVKAMTDKKKDYTLKLLGNYDIGAKLTLPTHSKYKSLTIDGNGYTLTFVGTTVTLTNDTTLKNLTLTALSSTGKAVRYTISKKNYNLTEENVNYGLGTVK